MTPNPFAGLIHSRKFWLAVMDASISTFMLLATRYLSPGDLQLVKEVIFSFQPVILAIIAAIAWEDGKRLEHPPVTQTVTMGANVPGKVTTTVTNVGSVKDAVAPPTTTSAPISVNPQSHL